MSIPLLNALTKQAREISDAQIEAGNYKKQHRRVVGLDISVENPAGSIRSGTDSDGKKWSVRMRNHYGYIQGSVGADKDHLDCFIRTGLSSESKVEFVHIVNQRDPRTSRFDEHKVMIGWDTMNDARKAYYDNYERGWRGLQSIVKMDIDSFKDWMKDKQKTKKPAPKGLEKKGKDSLLDSPKSAGKLVRYTDAGGRGVYAAAMFDREGKKQPKPVREAILRELRTSWELPYPGDLDNIKSYFTPRGADIFENTHKHVLKQYVEHIRKSKEPVEQSPIYEDEYQKIFKVRDVSLAKEPEDSVEMVVKGERHTLEEVVSLLNRISRSGKKLRDVLVRDPSDRKEYSGMSERNAVLSKLRDMKSKELKKTSAEPSLCDGPFLVKQGEDLPTPILKYLKRYDTFDKAHNRHHIDTVASNARLLASKYAPDKVKLAEIAAMLHDIGLQEGREGHEERGAAELSRDEQLKRILGKTDWEEVIHAVREHRASTGDPRTILAKIISDADRDPGTPAQKLRRAYEYNGDLTEARKHLVNKYGPGGYGRRHYFPETDRGLAKMIDPIIQAEDEKSLWKILKDAFPSEFSETGAIALKKESAESVTIEDLSKLLSNYRESGRQSMALNSPSLAYKAVYGREPDTFTPGRGNHPQKPWNGISVDADLPDEILNKLNSIPEIEGRASCSSHEDGISPTYYVFRMATNDAGANKVAENLRKRGLKALSDVGTQGRPRIVVAYDSKPGNVDWEQWWESLPEHIQAAVKDIQTPQRLNKSGSVIEALKRLKRESDRKNYSAKYAIFERLYRMDPSSFYVDSVDSKGISGITHKPSSFRFHIPTNKLPPKARQISGNMD